jgi:hypothetical protein
MLLALYRSQNSIHVSTIFVEEVRAGTVFGKPDPHKDKQILVKRRPIAKQFASEVPILINHHHACLRIPN